MTSRPHPAPALSHQDSSSTLSSSGFSSYSPLNHLDRQSAEPVGQRIHIFVRTNPNVYLAGGVESILKGGNPNNHNSQPMATTEPWTSEFGANSNATAAVAQHMMVDDDLDGSDNPSTTTTAADPFSFLGDDNRAEQQATSETVAETNSNGNNNKKKPGGGGVGRFLKKVAQSTTKTLERGMTNLAIRADGGKSPDWLFLGLYRAADHTVLSMTESLPVPMDETQKFAGLRFHVPLTLSTTSSLSTTLSPTDTVVIRVWIRSGAAMLQQRHYLLGQVSFTVEQLRSLSSLSSSMPQNTNFTTVTLQSNLVADGKLFLYMTPDPKFPPLCGPGWSLADPDPTLAYGSSHPNNNNNKNHHRFFHLPLDQAYGLSYPPLASSSPSSWLIATERSVESTVVLPIAAAFSTMAAQAARISMHHAESILHRVQAARHDTAVGEYVDCTIAIVGPFQPDATTTAAASGGGTGTPLFCSASWQRPDSIFEVDLLQPVRLPTTHNATATTTLDPQQRLAAAPTIRFYPKPVREGILPAVWNASEGRFPPSGFFLGTVRLQLDLTSRSHDYLQPYGYANTNTTSSSTLESWECLIGLEAIWKQLQVQSATTTTPTTMDFPVVDSARQPRGKITLAISMKRVMNDSSSTPSSSSSPPSVHVKADGGLLSLVGLTPLCDSVPPDFDTTMVPSPTTVGGAQQQQPGHLENHATRQQQQLATMGMFFTHGYVHYHCTQIRARDVKELEDRRVRYNAALSLPQPQDEAVVVVPPHEVRTPKAFRPSSSRMTLLLAGLPFNVHTASLSLHVADPHPKKDSPPPPDSVFCNVTCGAPADHARGFASIFPKPNSKDVNVPTIGLTCPVGAVTGGLRRLEAKRLQLAKHVTELQTALTMNVGNYFVQERQKKNMCNHVPSQHPQLQQLRWNLFEAYQSLHHLTWHCAVRRSSVFSQALGVATTSFLASLSDPNKWQSTWPEFWSKHGYLVTFEGLLSAAGKELGMIEDASVGISMLRHVSIVLRPDTNDNHANNNDPHKVAIVASPYLKWIRLTNTATHSGNHNSTTPEYTLEIGVVPSYFEQRIPKILRDGNPVRFYPLLFEVGVDIRQWGAHTGANMKSKLQKSESGEHNSEQPSVSVLDDEDDEGGFADDDVLVELNYEAFHKLNTYAHSISPVTSPTGTVKTHPLLENLYRHIVTSKGKISYGILDEAAALSQQLGGGGIVFCKSGKDRTAMHVTYKQAQYANQIRKRRDPSLSSSLTTVVGGAGEGGFPSDDTTTADATIMRIYGTRLPICEKNVGQAKYAFNSLQVKFMPDSLKPPMSTLAGFLKGGKVFQGGGIES